MPTVTGHCLCGAIAYAVDGPLPDARSCHCSQCRRAFSGAGSAMSHIAPNLFRWTRGKADLRTYVNKAGAGLGFCPTCGTTLCGVYKGAVMGITLGTLDGDPEVRIADHIFVGSKARWDEIGGDAPRHEAWPPDD
jgi:hypothetical protein